MALSASIELEPLNPARRADLVFDQLRSRILSGALPAGAQLPNERDLAHTLRVNRASVREALKRLEFLELIEVRHGHGSFVRAFGASSSLQLIEALMRDPATMTTELLRQLLEFRRHVICQVVELAARNRSPEHVARARQLVAEESRVGVDPLAALEIDLAMNALLGEASGNLMYRLVTNLFTKLISRLGPLYYNEQRDHRRSFETHRQLLAALERSDPVGARRILESMLDYSDEAMLREAKRLEARGEIGRGDGSARS